MLAVAAGPHGSLEDVVRVRAVGYGSALRVAVGCGLWLCIVSAAVVELVVILK